MARLIDEDTPGWVRWTVLGVVLVVLMIVGAFVWLLDPLSTHEAEPTPAPTTSTSTAAASSSICGLPDGDQAVPTKAPPASWDEVGNLFMPSSSALGPGKANGTSRTCFAHNPAGAVLAAMNPSGSSGANPTGVQYAGFRVTDATPSRVNLDLVLRATRGAQAGALVSVPVTLVWTDGDWKGINKQVQPTPLGDLTGFVAFGPGGA